MGRFKLAASCIEWKQALITQELIPRHAVQHDRGGADFRRPLDFFYRCIDIADRHQRGKADSPFRRSAAFAKKLL